MYINNFLAFLANANFNDPLIKLLGWDSLNKITIESIVLRLVLAVIFAGIIGIERASKRHAAGFRTYILVCLGACMAMMTNQFTSEAYNTGDVARLGAQVISGIGFLGAGTILVTSKSQIKGLTTAAGLWACACMGLAIGIGFYTLAIACVLVIIIALTLLPRMEGYFTERTRNFEIHIEFDSKTDLKVFIKYVRSIDLRIGSISQNDAYSSTGISAFTITIIQARLKGVKTRNHLQLMDEFRNLEYVNFVEEMY